MRKTGSEKAIDAFAVAFVLLWVSGWLLTGAVILIDKLGEPSGLNMDAMRWAAIVLVMLPLELSGLVFVAIPFGILAVGITVVAPFMVFRGCILGTIRLLRSLETARAPRRDDFPTLRNLDTIIILSLATIVVVGVMVWPLIWRR